MKRLFWVGSSHEDLIEFPSKVRRAMGFALHQAQMGEKPERAKVLSGLGNAKIWEIRENDESGTYRTIYTVEYKGIIFVLHAFQKKSKKGISTPKEEINLLKRRLKDAETLFHQLEAEEKS